MWKAVKRTIRNVARRHGYYIDILPQTASRLHDHLATLIENYAINCVLDVGAHSGGFGRMLRDAGYDGRIVSWEPLRGTYDELRRATDRDDKWVTHRYALGSQPGRRKINIARGTEASSFLEPNAYGSAEFGNKLDVLGSEEVEIRRLDDVFETCIEGLDNPVVLLKTDAQGYDLEVVRGAARSLRRIRAVQCELAVRSIYAGAPVFTQVISHLNEQGFELSGLFPVRIDKALRLIEMDCVMVRAGD